MTRHADRGRSRTRVGSTSQPVLPLHAESVCDDMPGWEDASAAPSSAPAPIATYLKAELREGWRVLMGTVCTG